MSIAGVSASVSGNYSIQMGNQHAKQEEKKSINGGDLKIGQQTDSVLESLRNQIERKQQEIDKLSENKEMSVKDKMEKQKQLEQEKKALETQYNQRQMQIAEEERQKEQEEMQEKMQDMIADAPEKSSDEVKDQARISAATTASLAMDQVSNLHKLKIKVEGEGKVAYAEYKSAVSYRPGSASTESKLQRMAEAESTAASIDVRISKQLQKANKASEDLNEVENDPDVKVKEIKEEKEEKEEKQEKTKESKEKKEGTKPEEVPIGSMKDVPILKHMNVSI